MIQTELIYLQQSRYTIITLWETAEQVHLG